MFDFSFGELAMIGAVALVVLGPERLPKVARTVGEWLGKAQRYVAQVKSDIGREMELAELRKMQEEARAAAQSVQSQVGSLQSSFTGAADELARIGAEADAALVDSNAADAPAWEGTAWRSHAFARRYRPGPSVDQLADEIERLKRMLAAPGAGAARNRYGRRARSARPRIYR